MGYIEIFLFVTFFAGILFLGFLFFFFVVFLWQYVIQYFVKNSKHNASSFSDKYVSSFVAYKGIDHSYKQHKRSSSPKNKEHDFKRRYTYLRKKRLSYIFGHFLYGLSWLFRFRAFKATPGSPSLLDNFCAVCKLPQFRPLRLVFVGGGFFMFAFIFFTVLIFRFAPDSSAADFTLSCSGTSGSPTNVTSSSYTASDSLVLEDGGSGYCVLDDVLTIGSLTIDSGVTLVHAANDSTGVKINAIGDVTVNGDIDVSSKGCLGTYGNDGSGPDDVVSGYDAYSCALRNAGYGNSHGDGSPGPGGGYGGAGGNTIWGGLGGVAYGSSTYPIHLGSSAGGSLIGFNNSTGGAGGGLIWISASGTLSVSGNVVSDGGLGGSTTYGASGGGSGGSIFLDADSISGSGIVRADGGDGSPPGDESVNYQDRSGGGGGGGRVYLTSCSDVSTFTTSTDGGLGPYAASDGSIGTWVTLARAGASCNTVPTATDPTVTTSTDGSGNISISTQVDDADNDNLQLIVEYKLGDCSSYASQSTTTLSSTITATNGQGSITHDNDDINSRQFQVIDTLSGANTLGFTWTSKTDVPSADGQYCLFLTPYDGASNGTVVSSTVTIDNTIPTSIGYPSVSVTSTTSITLSYDGTTTTETNFSHYSVCSVASTSSPSLSDTCFTTTTDSNLGDSSFNGATTTTVSGLLPNTQYSFGIFAHDLYGNTSTPLGSGVLTGYTLSVSPGAPTISSIDETSVSFTFLGDTNPTTTLYNIVDTNTNIYVASDDGLDSSTSVWQTTTTWNTPTITDLSLNTQYCFGTLAKNGDGIETATTTATCAYTLAASPSEITTDILSTKITVTWSSGNNSVGTEYYASISAGKTCEWAANKTSCVFSGLSIDTPYVITVKSRNGDNVDVAANAVTTRTLSSGGGTPSQYSSGAFGGSFVQRESLQDDNVIPVIINSGEKETDTSMLTLTLNVKDAVQVAIAMDGLFEAVSFEPYAKEIYFDLPTDTLGDKLICVRFRSSNGSIADACDSIRYFKKKLKEITSPLVEEKDDIPSKEVSIEPIDDNCPFVREKPYRAFNARGVYYITSECTKRIFTSEKVYFSYFQSFTEIRVVESSQLSAIPDDVLRYMSWGPLVDLPDNSFVKLFDDSKVHLIVGDQLHWIASPAAFEVLYSPFKIVHSVSKLLLRRYAEGVVILEDNLELFE